MVPRKIIIHHSATKDSGTVSWQAIRRYHVHDLEWSDIGYHYGIELIQDQPWALSRPEILLGRFPNKVGAHTVGENDRSIGICCIGDFDESEPPPEIWETCKQLVRYLMEAWGINKDEVHGHREFANKTCPGKKWDMLKFRNEL